MVTSASQAAAAITSASEVSSQPPLALPIRFTSQPRSPPQLPPQLTAPQDSLSAWAACHAVSGSVSGCESVDPLRIAQLASFLPCLLSVALMFWFSWARCEGVLGGGMDSC